MSEVSIVEVRKAAKAFYDNPTLENAHAFDRIQRKVSWFGLVNEAGERINPPDDLWPHKTHWDTLPVRQKDLETVDNSADKVITITISGNRLVALLNHITHLQHQVMPIFFDKEEVYREQIQDVETLRDILAIQRR